MPRAAVKPSKTKTTPYDVAEHLRTPEEMAAYLDAWLAEVPDDAAGIAKALGDIARAKGMSQVAKDAGLSRESLYRALSADRLLASPRCSRWHEHSVSSCTRRLCRRRTKARPTPLKGLPLFGKLCLYSSSKVSVLIRG